MLVLVEQDKMRLVTDTGTTRQVFGDQRTRSRIAVRAGNHIQHPAAYDIIFILGSLVSLSLSLSLSRIPSLSHMFVHDDPETVEILSALVGKYTILSSVH